MSQLATKQAKPDQERISYLSSLVKYKNKVRVKLHLLRAQAKVEKNTTNHQLSPDQASNRSRRLQELDDYIKMEEYPLNHNFAQREPFIRDESGTLCAMAYLIDQSGHPSVVDELDIEGRNLRIKEFKHPILPVWLEENGLTVDEAARIQPTYGTVGELLTTVNPFSWLTVILQIAIFSGIGYFYRKQRNAKLNLIHEYRDYSILPVLGILFTLLSVFLPLARPFSTGLFPLAGPTGTSIWQQNMIVLNGINFWFLNLVSFLGVIVLYVTLLSKSKAPKVGVLSVFLLQLSYIPNFIILFTQEVSLVQWYQNTITGGQGRTLGSSYEQLSPGEGFSFYILNLLLLAYLVFQFYRKPPRPRGLASKSIEKEKITSA